MLKALASSGRIVPHVRFRKEVRRRPEREPETGKEKLENRDSKSEGGVVFQFPISSFQFPFCGKSFDPARRELLY
jgi:hypothetical protein